MFEGFTVSLADEEVDLVINLTIRKAHVEVIITTPDFSIAAIEFANGAVARLTANFYVGFHSKQVRGIEFPGDKGSLFLSDWHNFNGTVEYAGFSGTWPDMNTQYEPLPYVKEPYVSKEKDDFHGGSNGVVVSWIWPMRCEKTAHNASRGHRPLTWSISFAPFRRRQVRVVE
jgi:predicted dehydrogenase